MGLFQKAVETYDAMENLVGAKVENQEMLAPVGYLTTTAKIEITVDADGNFVRANRIDEKIAIPCTEKSAGRSSGIAAHPLCDNLTYVTNLNEDRHNAYLEEINNWRESDFGSLKIDAIYAYLLKETVLDDCLKSNVITLDDKGKIKEEKDLVTWRVIGLGEKSGAVHEDIEIMKNFSSYYLENNSLKGICMVTGENENLALQHLKGVSNFSGNAKLISSNDTSNYTYRGRFLDDKEAMTMGYISSQKAHNTLKWLLSNYGVSMGDRRIVCWNPQGREIPKFNLPLLSELENKIEPTDYKEALRKVLNGYKANLPEADTVVIAAFEAATSGRLSITYYNELRSSDFLERLYYWDSTCCWNDNRWGTTSPALYQILKYAFGTYRDSGKVECDSRITSQYMQRLISCRLDKALFPMDIMRSIVIKASNIQIYDKNNAAQLLFTACAVIRKYKFDHFKEEWKMALDESVSDRSYLYGRLLAILEKIEKDTYKDGEARETNAIRTQAFYVQRPFTAFSQIMTSLKTGYYPRLSEGSKIYYEKLIGQIMEKISNSVEELDKPLSETYLMGYYLQKNVLYAKRETEKEEED